MKEALIMAPAAITAIVLFGMMQPEPIQQPQDCPAYETVNQEVLAEWYYDGYTQAYSDIITVAGELEYNPLYVTPERKPNR